MSLTTSSIKGIRYSTKNYIQKCIRNILLIYDYVFYDNFECLNLFFLSSISQIHITTKRKKYTNLVCHLLILKKCLIHLQCI